MLQMNREEKSLCHDAMVVNFLDDNQAQILDKYWLIS